MAELRHLPSDATAEALIDVLRRDGALIVDDLLASPRRARVMAEIGPYIEATPVGRDAFTGVATTRTGALVARSPACRDLVTDPLILAACDLFLLPACDRYQLHLTQAIRIRPGQPRQPLHRDRLAWGGYLQGVEPQLNTIWAMTEFTAANGATRVVPGSADWPADRRATDDEIAVAEMSPGSVLVYTGSVIHGGGENTTPDQDRIGLNITYCLGWLRQEENQYLSCPPAIARTLDPRLQALLGYAMGSYALGYFSPPVGPGEAPEAVPPEWALRAGDADAAWGDDLYAAVTERVRKAMGAD